MTQSFRSVVASLLPHEDRLLSRLRDLGEREQRTVLDYFSVALPEVDALIVLPAARPLGRSLASLRGLPLIQAEPHPQSGLWTLTDLPSEPVNSVALLTDHFRSGLPELEITLLASHLGWQVSGVAAVVERTNAGGRARLELNGVSVYAAAQVADTPTGLVLERRFPQVN